MKIGKGKTKGIVKRGKQKSPIIKITSKNTMSESTDGIYTTGSPDGK